MAEPWRLLLDLLQPGLVEILAALISVPTSTYTGFCPIRGDNITGQVGEVKEERCLSDWKSGLNQPRGPVDGIPRRVPVEVLGHGATTTNMSRRLLH